MSFCRMEAFMQEFSLISKCQREIQKVTNIYISNLIDILYEKLWCLIIYIILFLSLLDISHRGSQQ